MKTWKAYGIAVTVGASFVGQLGAQPVVPAAPVAPAAPTSLWSFLGLTKENHLECKRAFCESGFGQLFSNMAKPATAFTGGLLPNCCPLPGDLTKLTAAEIANLSPAEAAALKIQQYEAEAKARRAAVRYLGTVDCHWWKDDVEGALIAALREDRNECVRWEAAMALSRGCCCTKKIIETLAIVVAQTTDDNKVAENSPRVIDAARIALERCLVCQEPEIKPKKDPVKDKDTKDTKDLTVMDPPKAAAGQVLDDAVDGKVGRAVAGVDETKDSVKLTAFEKRLSQKSMADVVKNAELVLEQANRRQYSSILPSGRQGLADIAASSFNVTSMPAEMGGFPVDPTNPSPSLVDRVKQVMPDAFPESSRGRSARVVQPTNTVVASTVPAASGGGLLDRMARAIMPYAMQDTRPVVVNDTYTKADLKAAPVLATNAPSWRDASPMPKAPATAAPREAVQVAPADVAKPATPSTTSYVPRPTEQVITPAKTIIAPPTTSPRTPPTQAAAIVQTSAAPERSVTVVVRTSGDRLIQYLQDETYARLRDYAIDGFKPTDVATCEKVLPPLLQAARCDSTAKVRAACARCLGRMGLSKPEVLGTLEAMKSDTDANVRREAILALGRLQLMGKAMAATTSEPLTLPGQTP